TIDRSRAPSLTAGSTLRRVPLANPDEMIRFERMSQLHPDARHVAVDAAPSRIDGTSRPGPLGDEPDAGGIRPSTRGRRVRRIHQACRGIGGVTRKTLRLIPGGRGISSAVRVVAGRAAQGPIPLSVATAPGHRQGLEAEPGRAGLWRVDDI